MFFGFDKDKIAKKSVLVLSPNERRLRLISESLTLRGVEIQNKLLNFNEIDPKNLKNNELEAIILDLGMIQDINYTLNFIYKMLPKDIVCIVLADNDSIKIKQQFLDRGIKYLHFETQFDELYAEVREDKLTNSKFSSVRISVLGTKGGVGNSFVSYQLANTIYKRYKTKTLLIQGSYSSFNFDLMSNRNFLIEDYRENDICLYREQEEEVSVFEKFSSEKFNFIFYDQSVHCLDKDNIENMLNSSDCIVLVIDKELASIRKAQEILHANEFLNSVGQGVSKIIVVLNEISRHRTLNASEIKEILKRDIDISISFSSSTKEIKNMVSGKNHKEFEKLASLVIGQDIGKTKKGLLW